MKNTINANLLAMYGNPGSIQYRMLYGMENGVGEGKVIPTPNNIPSIMIEQFATIGSGIVQDVANYHVKMYPKQATTAEDLFRHISDYDYVGLYSTPSGTVLEISFLMDVLKAAAVEDPVKQFKKVILPRYSTFVVGDYTFSNYHPVEIRIRNENSDLATTVSVTYSEDYYHPLLNLTDNIIEHQITKVANVSILTIRLHVYQFKRSVVVTDIFTDAPCIRRVNYEDKFYATRVFTNKDYSNSSSTITLNDTRYVGEQYTDVNGITWTELGQTLESDIYDVSEAVIPSVVIQPDIENNYVKIMVPQVFLTEGRLGDKLKIEVYSTLGEIEATLDTTKPVEGTFKFDEVSATYSQPLYDTANISIYPLKNYIAGGSNGMTFEEFRDNVIYSGSKSYTITGTDELENELGREGFIVTNFKDGITRRILLLSRGLTLDNGGVTSGIVKTVFNLDESMYGVKTHSDGSFTVTPSTLFLYNDSSNICTPILTGHALASSNPKITTVVELNNNNTFTYTPFYIFVTEKNGITLATSYDFTNPSFDWLSITADSDTIGTVAVLDGNIVHDTVNNKYIVTFFIQGVEDSNDTVSFEVISATLEIPTLNGKIVLNTETIETNESGEKYIQFELNTDYHLNNTDMLQLTSGSTGYVNLNSRCVIRIDSTATYNDSSTEQVYAIHQFDMTLGKKLTTLFNAVHISTTEQAMVSYDADVYATYEKPVYELFNVGTEEAPIWVPAKVVTAGETTSVVMTAIHNIGDTIYDQHYNITITPENVNQYIGARSDDFMNGDEYVELANTQEVIDVWGLPGIYDVYLPRKLHTKGDPILDSNGNPQYLQRTKLIYVDMIHINNKVKYQSRDDAYMGESAVVALRNLITSYCTTVSSYINRVLGNTELYYQPTKAIGVAECMIGNPYAEPFELEISIKLRLHVARYVFSNLDEREKVREAVIRIIDNYLILNEGCSLVALSNLILTELRGIVIAVDNLGINSNSAIHTVMPVNKAVTLSLAHRMILGEDQLPTTERALTLEFVSA